eukprot:550797_1
MEQLRKFKMGQSICVTLRLNKELNGAFYCYDPESESVIIQNDEGGLIWINGHNIKSIHHNSLEQSTNTDVLQSPLVRTIELSSVEVLDDANQECKLSDQTLQTQQQLIQFLEEHQLSPQLDAKSNNIKIGSSLSIKPPYTTDCCRSSNEIILSMILNLLNDFHAQHNEIETESEDVLEID